MNTKGLGCCLATVRPSFWTHPQIFSARILFFISTSPSSSISIFLRHYFHQFQKEKVLVSSPFEKLTFQCPGSERVSKKETEASIYFLFISNTHFLQRYFSFLHLTLDRYLLSHKLYKKKEKVNVLSSLGLTCGRRNKIMLNRKILSQIKSPNPGELFIRAISKWRHKKKIRKSVFRV